MPGNRTSAQDGAHDNPNGEGAKASVGIPAGFIIIGPGDIDDKGQRRVGPSDKWNPYTREGRISQEVLGSRATRGDFCESHVAGCESVLHMVPGVNSAMVISDPKASTSDKVLAVVTDVPAVAGGELAEGLGKAVSGIGAAEGGVFYGANGAEAMITAEMIGAGTRASGSIRPLGWVDNAGFARGHFLGRQLGGSGTEARSLVTLFQNPANHPVMSGFEAQIRAAVEGGQVVNFGAMPIYRAGSAVPAGVTIVAEGSGGFSLAATVLNLGY